MQLPPEFEDEDTGSRRMLAVALISSAGLFVAILIISKLLAACQ